MQTQYHCIFQTMRSSLIFLAPNGKARKVSLAIDMKQQAVTSLHLVHESELWVVVAKVFDLFRGQIVSVLSFTSLPLVVFELQADEENGASDATDQQQCQRDTIPDGIRGSLTGDVDVACDDASTIAEADLHGRVDASFPMTAHIIAEPY